MEIPTTSSIFNESLNLIKLFGALQNQAQNIDEGDSRAMGLSGDEIERWLREPYLYFKAWATCIAALHRPHLKSSLDFRLQDAVQIKEQVLDLLKTLHGSLIQGQCHISNRCFVLTYFSSIHSIARAAQRVVDGWRPAQGPV